jgi:beta-lactamase regulating signal transducer with metallopeptidase domain
MHLVWQGGLIASVAALGLSLLRRATPNARYTVASVALAALVASPLITARLLTKAASTTSVSGAIAFVAATDAPAATDHRDLAVTHRSPTPDRALTVIVTTWLTGVVLLLLRLLGGWWRVRAIHQASLAMVASPWHAVTARLSTLLGLQRSVQVVESEAFETPTVLGWWRPVILLPVAALASLSPGQIEAILAHELAHIRRHEYVANLLQQLTETLLF